MTKRPSQRTGRRRAGERGTREAILAAARSGFAEHGFRAATIRMIAADAGVDPALVLHYYGNKADLFAAAVHMPVAPSEEFAFVTDVDRDQLGEALLRNLLGLWDDPDALAAWLGLLRSAMSDQRAMQMLREFLVEVVFETIGAALGDAGDDVDLRLSLVASQVVGLGLARHVVGLEPLASASTDDLVDAVAPNLQRYLTGELGSDTAGS